MNNKRIIRLQKLVVVIALAALMIPLAGANQAHAAAKVLKYWAGGEPDTIDPQVGSYTDDVAWNHAMFATLLRYDHKNTPSPYLAKEVPTTANGGINADGTVYTYHLRNDWKWSDGKGVVKAQDVVYAFQRLINPKTAGGYGGFLCQLNTIVNACLNSEDPAKVDQKALDTLGVKAVDDFTVQFTLARPVGYFNQIASLWFGSPVRKDNVERAGLADPSAWLDPANGPVVSSGPFTISKWDHNKEIVFTKNPNFGGTPAKLDEIDVSLVQDTAISYAGFKAGELDVSSFPTAEYKNIKADSVLGKQLIQYENSCSFYLAFDNTKPPFNDEKVREAFTYALDRDQYVHIIAQDIATKQLFYMPADVAGAAHDPNLGKAQDFNADKAKAALAASKYPDPATFPAVNFNYGAGANGQRRADYLQAQFQKILGITIVENPMDAAVYQAATSDPINKLAGMEVAGWCSDYLHPSDWLYPVFGSGGKAGNATNLSGFNSAEFDTAAQKADAEPDPAKAAALYKNAESVLVNSFAVAFLENTITVLLVNPKVTNLPQSSLDGGYPGSFWFEEVDISG